MINIGCFIWGCISLSKKSKLFSIIFLVIVFFISFGSIFHDEDIPKLISYLAIANFRYVIASILCVLIFICGESVILFYMFRNLGIDTKLLSCCSYSFIGFFYSCITPSASGGQPMQIVSMRKDKIPVAVSTVVLAIVAIIYKFVLVLIGLAVLIIHPFGVMDYLAPVLWFMYLGIFLNVVCIIGLLLLVFKQDWVHNILMLFLNLYDKIFHLKNREKRIKNLKRIIAQYEGTAEYYRSHTSQIYVVFIITFIQRFFLFLITWLTYRSD